MDKYIKLTIAEAKALLEVLSHHVHTDDGEYNNQDVIDACEELEYQIEEVKQLED